MPAARNHHLLSILLFALALPPSAHAAWTSDPLTNLPVCTAAGPQMDPSIVTDGSGGAFLVWSDLRGGADYDVYAQHVLRGGVVDPAWPVGGLLVAPAPYDQTYPKSAPDGSGGLFVTWGDSGQLPGGTWFSDIYVQHVLANGTLDPAWPSSGAPVCVNDADQFIPVIAPDGAHGAYIAWVDYRIDGITSDLFAQHVLPDGTSDPAWPSNGAPVCTAPNDQLLPVIAPDGIGGAVLVWQDSRGFPVYGWGAFAAYVQHLSPAGIGGAGWPSNGRAASDGTISQEEPAIIGDGSGGAIVSWTDAGGWGVGDIYAQHVMATGAVDPAWTTRGVAVCSTPDGKQAPRLVSDGSGGAIVGWEDPRNQATTGWDIYAQRVLASGARDPGWPMDGIAACVAPDDQAHVALASDGAHGAIITCSSAPLLAQHLLSSGTTDPAWPADGSTISSAPWAKQYPAMLADGEGGATIVWEDYRASGTTDIDIYAQHVRSDGVLGSPLASAPRSSGPALSLEPVSPNPSRGGSATVRFSLKGDTPASLGLFDVHGRVAATWDIGSLGAGPHAVRLGGASRVAPGLYFVRLEQGGVVRVSRWAVLE